jgi:hypothetical protein
VVEGEVVYKLCERCSYKSIETIWYTYIAKLQIGDDVLNQLSGEDLNNPFLNSADHHQTCKLPSSFSVAKAFALDLALVLYIALLLFRNTRGLQNTSRLLHIQPALSK